MLARPNSNQRHSQKYSEILNNCNSKDLSITPIQKLLLTSITERDISAQETCHLLLSIPLYHSSRSYVSLNLNDEAVRWVVGTGSNKVGIAYSTINEARRISKSPLTRYWSRPEEFEDFSLYKLYLT